MIFLFIGMIASGISSRVSLLSHRGGWLLEDQVRKSVAMVGFDLVGTISGIVAFFLSFLLFDWWLPLVAMIVGYWLIAPLIVTRNTYPLFYHTQIITSSIALACSIAICSMYFSFF